MLAYVFWHVPRTGTVARAYESAHGEFHDVLRAAGVAGLLGVRVFRLESIPWLDGQAGYEDWHLLSGSAALDVLNSTAVNEARQRPHDAIAAMAGTVPPASTACGQESRSFRQSPTGCRSRTA